jgi:CBS domain containing-hemolysin-like protein
MVPRIDMFMHSSSCLIEEAAQAFVQEGYSRVPVYKNSMDNIIGVLLYKDLLNFYVESEKAKSSQISHLTVESLLKPVVYTPETKKISILLQELKAKQIHLAIVVDEYGGTEGIVTIEDILEELVGEIGDEYDDIKQDSLYSEHPQGGWIVDAKMNIIDIEKELTISIPHSPEYDTIGGYIFHRSGSIPTKGWKIHHENFDLEILKSSDRSVEKVRITPSINEEI